MKNNFNIGLIGYKFMGKAHSFAYKNANLFFNLPVNIVMKTLCGRHEKPLKIACEQFGWESIETDWKKVVRRQDIDLIDIVTPPNFHKDIMIESAKEGKIVFCEKPLSTSLSDSYNMLEIVEKYKVKHAVSFNYRKLPAVALAKKLIAEGKIGKIYHMRAVYLQDWILNPDFPLVWRLQKNVAGSGSHGDLNAHLIDLAHFLVGEFDRVMGVSKTFIKERPLLEENDDLAIGLSASTVSSTKKGFVDVDDTTAFLCEFKNGAVGTFEATRFAAGRKNYERFEINGSKGSVIFNLERLNELEYYSTEDETSVHGFRNINVTNAVHPYAGNFWPDGHIIGYGESFINEVADLIIAVNKGDNPSPDFYDGVKSQEVLDSVAESVRIEKWTKVNYRG